MITTAQIRAARGLLKWTQATLAHRAALSTATLNMIENETVQPRPGTLTAIQRALESGGVQLLDEDGAGVGVRFAQRDRASVDQSFAASDNGSVHSHPAPRSARSPRANRAVPTRA